MTASSSLARRDVTRISVALLLAALLAATVVAACGPKELSAPQLCFLDCPSPPAPPGGDLVTSIVGFPRTRVDTTGPRGAAGFYIGRLGMGESVVLYAVHHEWGTSPCAASDTVRIASWTVRDSTVLRPRSDTGGRGVFTAVKAGQWSVSANIVTPLVTQTIFACSAAPPGLSVEQIVVGP